MSEIVEVKQSTFRTSIPARHQQSLDTRLAWLWEQRFGTIQRIWQRKEDVQDHMACTIILQAIMAEDLKSIEILFQRLEGGALEDSAVASSAPLSL